MIDIPGFDYVEKAAVVFVVVGAMRGWWIAAPIYRREVERGDHLEMIATRATTALERITRRRGGKG